MMTKIKPEKTTNWRKCFCWNARETRASSPKISKIPNDTWSLCTLLSYISLYDEWSVPERFREETVENIEGYHAYKKRNNCKTILIGNYHVDNRNLVPFNFLLKRYQAHINFEVCPSVKSIKYIF